VPVADRRPPGRGRPDDGVDRIAELVAGLATVGWTDTDLWLAAFALGGDLSAADIGEITAGNRSVGRIDWDVLAAAINDGCADQGLAPPMRYWTDFPANDP
jgi:hypothetical protein